MQSLFIIVLCEIKADGRKLHSIFVLFYKKKSELNNKMRLIGDLFFLSLSLSLKNVFFIRVAYFNHAANLLTYFNELLKINKEVTLNRLTDCIYRSKFV